MSGSGAEDRAPRLDAGAALRLAGRLRRQGAECARLGSPLYAGLLARAAADAEAAGPTWELLRGHEDDPPGSALALRLLGAVHRLVLQGRLPALAPHFAEGPADPEAAWPLLRDALTAAAVHLRPLLDRPVQTNESARCAALLPGFLAVAERTGLPLRVLELGAAAGLNLRWDHYRYLADGFSWGDPEARLTIRFELDGEPPPAVPVEVAERRGCDRAALDPSDEDGRLTLLSYLWPGQPDRVERLLGAIAVAAEVPAPVDRADAGEWVEPLLAAPVSGVATVVFHSIFAQYLGEDERRRLFDSIAAAGERAEDDSPLAWLRMEAAGPEAEVRLTQWPGGEERLLATAGYHGAVVRMAA